MEGQTENQDPNSLKPASGYEMSAKKLNNPSNPDNLSVLSSRGPLEEGGENKGEPEALATQGDSSYPKKPGLPNFQDLTEGYPFFPDSDNLKPNPDYPNINSKKGIISMILGFLEFLLRIFGFKKDKFPKI